MKFFGKIGSSKKHAKRNEAQNPEILEAIQMFREREDMLAKKEDQLERKIKDEIQIARTNASSNKKVALQALRRKRRYEKQLSQVDGILTSIEMQRETLEGATTNIAVLDTLTKASKALKTTNANINVDDVEDLMNDLAEHQDMFNDISNAISSPVGFDTEVDEDELQKELEELEQEDLDTKLLQDIPQIAPKVEEKRVPVAEKPRVKVTEVEEDLKELEAWGASS